MSNRGKRAQYRCGITRLGAECEEVASEVLVRVRMWVQGLGQGRAAVQCAAVQSGYAVRACVGAVELSVTGVERCVQGFKIVWGGQCIGVCTCAHEVCSAGQVLGGTDGETDGLCCRFGGPGLLSAQEGQSREIEVS